MAAFVASACQVDERDLRMTTVAASAGVGSTNEAGSSAAGQGGEAANGNRGGDGSLPGTSVFGSTGGEAANGGAAGGGGTAGGLAGNGAGGLTGTSADNGAGGTTAGHGTSGGTGGATGSSNCGDIDQNGIDDCSETLIQNSRFDLDTSYWVTESLVMSSWDSRNARSGAGSGSLLISNQAPVDPAVGSFMSGAHQCVQVNANAGYEVAVRLLIPGGQGAGEAGVNLQIFAVDNCAGSFLDSKTLDPASEVDAWSVVKGDVRMPSAARSMWLRLVVSKPFTQTTLEALFDDVLVRPN